MIRIKVFSSEKRALLDAAAVSRLKLHDYIRGMPTVTSGKASAQDTLFLLARSARRLDLVHEILSKNPNPNDKLLAELEITRNELKGALKRVTRRLL